MTPPSGAAASAIPRRREPGAEAGLSARLGAGPVRAGPAGGALRGFLRDGATYWAAMLAVGVLNMGFNLVAARRLAPVAYGEFAAIAALVNVFLFADEAVTRTVAANVAALDDAAAGAWLLRRGCWRWTGVGAAGALLVGACAGPLASALHLDRPHWLWIAALALVPGYAGAVAVGVQQGLRLFGEAGAANLGAAVLKFAVLLLLLGAGWGVTGASLATLTEVTAAWLLPSAMLQRRLRGIQARPAGRASSAGLSVLPTSLTVARLLFFNLDVLMARHFLGPEQAGLFAALGVTGRIIAYGTGALPPVIYPYLVRYRTDVRLSVRYLLLTLAATALSGGIGIAALVVAPGPLVRALFGASFQAIGPYVGWYGLAFLLYSLTYVLLHYLLARESWWVWGYALGGSLLEAAALAVFHRGIGQFTEVVAVFFAVMFVSSAVHAALLTIRGGPRCRVAPAGSLPSGTSPLVTGR